MRYLALLSVAVLLSGEAARAAEPRAASGAERVNLLPNPDMAQADGGKVGAWHFAKGDAPLFSSVVEAGKAAVRFRAPGRYTTASQSIRLEPRARYRLEARVKGSAEIYIRARTVLRKGASSTAHTAWSKRSKQYVRYEVPFPTGPDGKTLILIGNTEGGGRGEVFVTDLAVVREDVAEALGPAIPTSPGDGALRIRKIRVADCRALKGFLGTPVDGSTESRGWGGGVWEYGQRGAGAGVGYAYRNNDGLHVTLADKGGFNAVRIRGDAACKLYRDCPKYDSPDGGVLLASIRGRSDRWRVWFDKPVMTDRVSFFARSVGRIADVSFFRVGRGTEGLGEPVRLGVASAAGAAGPVAQWLNERFYEDRRVALRITPAPKKPAAISAGKGRTFHLIGAPSTSETALAAVGLDFTVHGPPGPVPLTLAVQDPLNPRSELLGADIVLSKPGRCRVVLDFPDQVIPKGSVLWVSVTPGVAARFSDVSVSRYAVRREQALGEALAYRKVLLKAYFCALSEARPWMGWYDDKRLARSLAEPRWGPQLKQLVRTLDQCKTLGPADDLVRQYDEWIWRQHRQRRKTSRPFAPRIDKVPGAPRWAVVARQAWLTARDVPRWWLAHRMVPTGEFGGMVGDDTDMYQNYADFPMFETGGVAADIKDGADRLMALAEKENLEKGLNRRTMDPLHAYEEGINHLALLAWWHYGDPVHFERCMVSAASTEALTVVTAKGHRHFKSQQLGAADLRMARKTDVDGHAHPLMWHPTLEVAWYNHNPRALRNLTQWGDGWLAHMRPGKYATSVEVASERVTATTARPLYGGYGGLGSAMLFLYGITGREKYVAPFFETFATGSRNTSPHLILPELIHRHGLGFLGKDKLRKLVAGEGAAETLVTGDKGPLIDALKADIAELQRFGAMYTTAEPYTDRVFLYAIRNAAIAYTGGYASRNKLQHTHAVSWGGFGTDYAALVLKASPDVLKVLVYSFAARPLAGRMRVWTLSHGRYRLRIGTDGDGDDRMDAAGQSRLLELARGTDVPVTLPPRKVTVIELTRQSRGDDERLRADLALSAGEVRAEGGKVLAVAHNIGSRAVESFDVALVDSSGKVRIRKTLGPLGAPVDLVPRRLGFAIGPLPAGARGWAVLLDPDGRVPEIHEGNNRAPIP